MPLSRLWNSYKYSTLSKRVCCLPRPIPITGGFSFAPNPSLSHIRRKDPLLRIAPKDAGALRRQLISFIDLGKQYTELLPRFPIGIIIQHHRLDIIHRACKARLCRLTGLKLLPKIVELPALLLRQHPKDTRRPFLFLCVLLFLRHAAVGIRVPPHRSPRGHE